MTVASHLYLPTLDRVMQLHNRERAALYRSYTWHFSMQGLPFRPVTQAGTGALTSRFHPYDAVAPRLFSVALSRPPPKAKKSRR